VHDHHVVNITSGSFEKETVGANPHSGAYDNDPGHAAKNAADLETDSCFFSAYRSGKADIPHTRNNWVCYDFKERRIVPTHYTIRTNHWHAGDSGDRFRGRHLKSWIVETSADGENWRELDQQGGRYLGNKELNGCRFTGTFVVVGREFRFIRLVTIDRNHEGSDLI
jgi:hypothetical protein